MVDKITKIEQQENSKKLVLDIIYEYIEKDKKQLLKKIAKIWAFNSTLVKTLN